MKVTLVRIIIADGVNGNGSYSEKIRMKKDIELIMLPQNGMFIKFDGNDYFYINYIKQDLDKNKIFLFYQDNICHRKFWNDTFLLELVEKYESNGWTKTNVK